MAHCFHCKAPLTDQQTACFACGQPVARRDAWLAKMEAAIEALPKDPPGRPVLEFRRPAKSLKSE